jgi:hypothetical protein
MNKDFVTKLQKAMNDAGADPKFGETGKFGVRTEAELENYDFTISAKKKLVVVAPVLDPHDYFGAPWVGANIDLLGRDETDPVLNARYVPEWKLEGLPGYKTLAGNTHAWCSVRANADRRKVGVKGTNSAGAASWSKWGKKCPFWFGAALDIKHRGGGRHICDFLYWIDEKKKICATLDGNRSNKFAINRTDLSGAGDTLATGPRWSNDWPDGQLVSMSDVLKSYPLLKVGASAGGSTR